MFKKTLVYIFSFISTLAVAQEYSFDVLLKSFHASDSLDKSYTYLPGNVPLNRDVYNSYESTLNDKNINFHTSIKPYLSSDFNNVNTNAISFMNSMLKNQTSWDVHVNNPEKGIFELVEVIPLLSLQYGNNFAGKTSAFEREGGFMTNIAVGKKLFINAYGIAGNTEFTEYQDSAIKYSGIVPGMGRAYKQGNGFTYQNFGGYVSFSPNKYFNFQAGKDKHFWGDGYRTLFLSDAASNFPFLKVTTNVWKIKYVNLFTQMTDASTSYGFKRDFKTKYATFHYLSWNITKRINIGIFESIIWQGNDSTRKREFDPNYLNPVIFYRPTEYSLGSSDNAFFGASFKVKLFKKQQLYGQIILDEFFLDHIVKRDGWWANKQGFQIGAKSFDLFGVQNLNIQGEFNYVRPYTYSHGSVQQAYGHLNQPLAHPVGANFMEGVGFLTYKHKRFIYEGKAQVIMYGADTSAYSYGKNIFISYINRPNEFGNYTTQGLKTTLVNVDLRVAYILLPSINLIAEIGINNRIESSSIKTFQTNFVYFSLKTSLWNRYFDF